MTQRFSPAEAAQWTGGTWEPAAPAGIDGVSHDTRTLRAGALYVAIKGERFDGHDFLAQAFAQGACAAMVARGSELPAAGGRCLLRVDDTSAALCALAAGYRTKIAPLIVAVTGSVGKSTVKEMTAQILSRWLKTACTPGNWNNEIGLPLSLLAMERDTRVGVFELGISHPGEMAPLCRILSPRWAIITNVGPAHVEFFGSVEAIAREKAVLVQSLAPDGLAVVNADTPHAEVFRSAAACRLMTVSMERDADYRCLLRDPARRSFTVRERSSGETFTFRLSLPGSHNIMNALPGIAVARQLALPWTKIAEALAAYVPLPMRWEETTVRGVRVVNDAYNANPVSMRAALSTFAEERSAGRRWVVLGGMRELGAAGEAAHRDVGALVAAGPWAGLVTVGPLAELIADSAAAAGFDAQAIWRCGDVAQAAAVLRAQTADGDIVLLKGSRGNRLEGVLERFAGNQEV
jgi:UDP-N-acetylmuramoyl-tripeptide--D-alanyl-D-alanine ligase